MKRDGDIVTPFLGFDGRYSDWTPGVRGWVGFMNGFADCATSNVQV